jgi:hypothetical protein
MKGLHGLNIWKLCAKKEVRPTSRENYMRDALFGVMSHLYDEIIEHACSFYVVCGVLAAQVVS